ncbi:MAG: 2Fe-2S iron-sulfur cluster-binding protein [Bacteroidota bacterium]
MELKINGTIRNVELEDNMPLLWVLRNELNLTGTKYGCGVAACGACTCHVDGQAFRTCMLPAAAAVGKEIKTIEGVAENGQLSAIQKA